MKLWKLAVSLWLMILLWGLLAVTAHGEGFTPTVSGEEYEVGDSIQIAFPYDGSLGEVAAFRVRVEYDPQVLEYLRPQYNETLQEGFITTQDKAGAVESVYTAPGDGPYLTGGETIEFRFRVREDAPWGSSSLFASVFEIASPEPVHLFGDVDLSIPFHVLEPPSDDARLLSLVPDSGTLEPSFHPDTYEYTMTVPYEVKSITFTAETVPGAVCRVNRKNLGSGGSYTVFLITVTAEDGKTKQEYQVTVYREEKEEEPPLRSDAFLLSLTPESGQLSPTFDPDQFTYQVTVPFEVTTMTFQAQPSEGATYRVNRKNLGAGGSDTLFTITVTAEDGETKTEYFVTVHRQEKQTEENTLSSDARLLSLIPESGQLSPAFDPAHLTYHITVPFEVTTMAFDAQPSEGASYRVNRKNLGAGGSDTLFAITVTAEDGETKTVYQVTVHREEKQSTQTATSSSSQKEEDAAPDTGKSELEESDVSSQQQEDESPPVVGDVEDGSGSSTGGDNQGQGGASGGIVIQNGDASFVPGMLTMLVFVMFCFLSGPLAKEMARRFPGKGESKENKEEK